MILVDHLGVVQQTADEGRLTVVNAPTRQQAQKVLAFVFGEVGLDIGDDEVRSVRHQKYPSRFFSSIDPEWSWSMTRPSRSERVAKSISWIISGSVVAVDSMAPDSG